jgi:hypothetical protein
MLTPKEQEAPLEDRRQIEAEGTGLCSPRPSRDISPYEGARLSVKQPARARRSLRPLRWPVWLMALEGIRLR